MVFGMRDVRGKNSGMMGNNFGMWDVSVQI